MESVGLQRGGYAATNIGSGKPSHSPTLDTLKKLAAADIGLIVKFVPFSEMVKRNLIY